MCGGVGAGVKRLAPLALTRTARAEDGGGEREGEGSPAPAVSSVEEAGDAGREREKVLQSPPPRGVRAWPRTRAVPARCLHRRAVLFAPLAAERLILCLNPHEIIFSGLFDSPGKVVPPFARKAR